MPGVNVTVTSVERNTSDTVVTNGSGNYTKDRLLPGTYEVKAELSGFNAALAKGIRVSVDTQTKVDLKLAPGATDTITVVGGEGQLLKTDRADVATTFDQRQVTELPILDRNFTKFLLLTPGTQQQSWGHAASENPQGSAQTVVNGQTFSGTGYQLDGTDNRDPILGIIVINPTLESIGESKVTSQNYEAEFGQAIAGVVAVQTKSGRNELYGSAFEFHRTDKFQARNPFSQPDVENPLTGRVLPETKKDQFGAVARRPAANATSSSSSATTQGTRSSIGGAKRLTVPTALARQGNFSEYGVNIYDPAGGDPNNRQQFAGNVIPTNRLSPQALAILNLLPLPNAPGIRDNYIAQGSEAFDNDAANLRLDGRLSENLNLFARYSYQRYDLTGPQAFGAGGGSELVSLGGQSKVRNHSRRASAPTTPSTRRRSWTSVSASTSTVSTCCRTTSARRPRPTPASLASTSTTPSRRACRSSSSMAAPTRSASARASTPAAATVRSPSTRSSSSSSPTSPRSSATTPPSSASTSAAPYNLRVPSDAHRSGQLYFEADRTRGPDGGGIGIASFMLGDVTKFSRYVSSSTKARERQWREFFYAQDTWRATPKLTVAYGLRTDIINPQTVNEAGNGGWLDIATGRILVGGVGDVNLAGNVKNKINWAPRLGITYQLDEKTVVRLGYGRSYDIGVFGSTFGHAVTQNLPVLALQEQHSGE